MINVIWHNIFEFKAHFISFITPSKHPDEILETSYLDA